MLFVENNVIKHQSSIGANLNLQIQDAPMELGFLNQFLLSTNSRPLRGYLIKKCNLSCTQSKLQDKTIFQITIDLQYKTKNTKIK